MTKTAIIADDNVDGDPTGFFMSLPKDGKMLLALENNL